MDQNKKEQITKIIEIVGNKKADEIIKLHTLPDFSEDRLWDFYDAFTIATKLNLVMKNIGNDMEYTRTSTAYDENVKTQLNDILSQG